MSVAATRERPATWHPERWFRMQPQSTHSLEASPLPKHPESFWARVDKVGPLPEYRPELGRCWIWTGPLNRGGYGHFYDNSGKTARAHRLSFSIAYGSIPVGAEVDHLCRVRRCVRPDHLEAVTKRENILRGHSWMADSARKTHCVRGHEFNDANTYRNSQGHRYCRPCRILRARKYKQAKRAAQ